MSFMKSGKKASLKGIPSKAPSWFTGTVYAKGEKVTNRYTGKSAYLDGVCLSMYDYILGAEATGMVDHDLYDKCKSYIAAKSPGAYSTLIA